MRNPAKGSILCANNLTLC